MSKLMVRRGRKPPFHPRIRIWIDGHYRYQWAYEQFKPGVFCGENRVGQQTMAQVVAHYFAELRRCGHEEVPAS